MNLRAALIGMAMGFMVAACASDFPYRHFGLGPNAAGEIQGTLLGKKPADDRDLRECAPTEHDKGVCVVLFTDEFEKMRIERIELLERLKACESAK